MSARVLAALVAAALLAGAIAPARAAAPDSTAFAGAWELDLARSAFGRGIVAPPLARRDTIERTGREIHVRSHIRKKDAVQRLRYRYVVGEETVNTLEGHEIVSRTAVEDGALAIVNRAKVLLFDLRVEERWRLEAGGRTLVIERVSHSPLGRQPQTLVFRRATR